MKKDTNAGPTGTVRVVQIHPSRLCNLSCLHCYSSSSPKERGALSAALLSNALSDAAAEGYNYVSLSGGEPLLYKPIGELLAVAKQLGFGTAIVTNGMLLDARRLEMLSGVTDLIAVSLDGIPESHNRMRNSEIAFEKMEVNLEGLKRSGIPFGFIFTLTQYNLDELDWVVQFALEQGAELLQIHPLEDAGFASEKLPGEAPDRTESAYAYMLGETFRKTLQGQLTVQVDFANRNSIMKHPELVYATDQIPSTQTPLADCVGSIAIEPDGVVVPMEYGFSRNYAIGDLNNNSLSQLADEWRKNRMDYFYLLCRNVYSRATGDSKPLIFNWDAMLRAASHRDILLENPNLDHTQNPSLLAHRN